MASSETCRPEFPVLAPRPAWSGASIASTPPPILTHSDSEWAAAYPDIERLYVRERRKLRFVMQYMASEHGFQATEQMYKKRFARWGFKKNSKRSAANHRPLTKDDCRHVASRKAGAHREMSSMEAFPRLDHRDGLVLAFLTNVKTWSVAFFESVPRRNGSFASDEQRFQNGEAHSTKEPGFAFKLVIDLLDRGRGVLAGKVTRKAFLLLENMLTLEGPGAVWNILEIMHYIVSRSHMQLFQILLVHLIALADGRVGKSHPLTTILRSLRSIVNVETSLDPSQTPRDFTTLIERAWTLNAEILFNNFDPGLFQLYCRLLWESSSLEPPAAILFKQLELQQSSRVTPIAERTNSFLAGASIKEDRLMKRILTPRKDASLPLDYKMLRTGSFAALREHTVSLLTKGSCFNGNTKMLLPMLAGLATADVLEHSPGSDDSRMHAGNSACAIKILIDIDTDCNATTKEAYLDTVERIRAIVALREYAEYEAHPQVVQELWQLQKALIAAGKYEEAEEVERDAYHRVENYILDVTS
ncbi:Nn.00g070370.m01.CDS01 [Neocucurbitaria sp. VM-36]